eukprot:177001-Amphidinium_carterae.6
MCRHQTAVSCSCSTAHPTCQSSRMPLLRLNDQSTDFAIARRVLSEYHPSKPELWMQLASFLCRPYLARGTLKRLPSALTCPERALMLEVQQHEPVAFFRKSNDAGAIAKHIRQQLEA